MTCQPVGRPVGRRVRVRTLLLTFVACLAVGGLPRVLLAGGEASGEAQGAVVQPTTVVSVGESGSTSRQAPNVAAAELAPPPEAVAPLSDKPNTAASKGSSIELSYVESIRVRVWGNAELSGDYNLDPHSALSFPRIGRIETAGLTTAELERLLADKLSALTRTDVTVAVDVTRYRPYFIMGQVAQAGAIEWRPGLKVIQAISLAHGVIRSTTDDAAGQSRGIGQRQSESQLVFALVQLARLKAEREGKAVVDMSSQIDTLISRAPEESRATLTALIARQNPMLQEQRAMMQTQIDGLHRDRKSAERELEAASTQEKAVLGQLELTRAQLADIEGLRARQLVTKSRYLGQKSDLLTAEVRYAEAHTILERARGRLGSIDQQLVALPQQRRALLNEQIDALEREVSPHLDPASAGRQDALKLNYFIAREGTAGVRTIIATVFTEVLPGDVLIISGESDHVRGVVAGGEAAANDNSITAAEAAQRMIEAAAVDAPAIAPRAVTSATESRSY